MYRWMSVVRALVLVCAASSALVVAAEDESSRMEIAKLILVESGQ